jgi:2,4-dienoyl-CoA reductase-like NADH-dependent reductase (Old Yellow Enzyme family)
MTDAVHELDGHIVMQIAHGGIASMTAARRRGDCLAVSTPIRPPPNGAPPRQMTDADIEAIVEDFGRAAARVEEAGFDGVQIHGAHGYLVTQFLSPKSNRRTDRWPADRPLGREPREPHAVRRRGRARDAQERRSRLPHHDQARLPGLPG